MTYRRDSLVLGAAVGVLGVSFGVLAEGAGLGVLKTCVLSLTVFTGASQFAAVGVADAGGSIGATLGPALLLAARNVAYGVAMAPIVGRSPLARRLVAAQLVVDETTAMATAQRDPGARAGAFWFTGAAIYGFWNAGTLIGALAGTSLGDPEALGIDAAFPAGFVALVAPHLRSAPGRVAGAVGAVTALGLVPFVAPGLPVVVAAAAVVPARLFSESPRSGEAHEGDPVTPP